MALPISALNSALNLRVPTTTAVSAPGGVQSSRFGQAFEQALKSVSQTQAESSQLQVSMSAGVEGASIEKTMIAMQKSTIALTAAVTVRNKMVSAYSDIMNMQV